MPKAPPIEWVDYQRWFGESYAFLCAQAGVELGDYDTEDDLAEIAHTIAEAQVKRVHGADGWARAWGWECNQFRDGQGRAMYGRPLERRSDRRRNGEAIYYQTRLDRKP